MPNNKDVDNLTMLLLKKSSDAAFAKLISKARNSKQSVAEIARRTATNVLRSMQLRQNSQ